MVNRINIWIITFILLISFAYAQDVALDIDESGDQNPFGWSSAGQRVEECQTFLYEAGDSKNPSYLEVYSPTFAGSGDSVHATINELSGGDPTTVVETSEDVAQPVASTGMNFTFNGSSTLTNGTSYGLCFNSSYSSNPDPGTNTYTYISMNSNSGYPDGKLIANTGAGWVDYGGALDFNMTFYVSDAPAPPTPIQNSSIGHLELLVNDTIFNSVDYITVLNSTFNFSASSNITVRGEGQLSKPVSAGSSTLSARIILNGDTIIDEELRTVDGTTDRGAFTIPFSKNEAVLGVNNFTVEFKEDGAGSVNVSDFEIDILTDNADNGDKINIMNYTSDFTFSSSSYINVANFSVTKNALTNTFIDVNHQFSTSGTDTTPSCYFENNNTNERTIVYERWLETSTETGSSGVQHFSNDTSTNEDWQLFCKSTDTDTITNNVSITIIDLVDDDNHTIQGFQNSTSNQVITSGTTTILKFNDYNITNGTGLSFMVTIIAQSGSGTQDNGDSPLFILNSSTNTLGCEDNIFRSFSDNDDIGTIKFYNHCHNLSVGELHDFEILVTVSSGNNLTILNASLTGFEVYDVPFTIENIAPIISFDTFLLPNGTSETPINGLVIEFENGNYTVNTTVDDVDGTIDTFNFTIYNSSNIDIFSTTDQNFVINASVFVDFQNPFNFTLFANDTQGLSTNLSILMNFTDTTNPTCDFSDDSATINTNYTFGVTCTDENFFKLNVSCDLGYDFEVTGLNVESYSFTGQFNVTSTTSCSADYYDGHTKKDKGDIKVKDKPPKEKMFDDKVKVIVEETNILSFDLIDEIDRFKFNVSLSVPDDTYTFNISSDSPIIYLSDSDYACHLVTGDYWIDFENDYFYDCTVNQVSSYEVIVDVELINFYDNIIFESIGTLNSGQTNFTITANPVPTSIGAIFNSVQVALYWFLLFFVWIVFLILTLVLTGKHGNTIQLLNIFQGMWGVLLGLSFVSVVPALGYLVSVAAAGLFVGLALKE